MQLGEGAQDTLGMFINTLPVRMASGETSVLEGVAQAHAMLSGLLAHESASLALAQRCSTVPASSPLFSTLLNYRHARGHGGADGMEGIEMLDAQERTHYPCVVSVDDDSESLGLVIQVSQPYRASDVGEAMHQVLAELVAALDASPDTPLRQIGAVLSGLEVAAKPKRKRAAMLMTLTADEPDEVAYAAPATATEQAVAAVWAEVLGVERVGLHDDFFALGGQSLMVMRVTTRLRSHFQCDIALRSLFETPTLAAFAAGIDMALQDSEEIEI
jgi:aryl carrier-like protein